MIGLAYVPWRVQLVQLEVGMVVFLGHKEPFWKGRYQNKYPLMSIYMYMYVFLNKRCSIIWGICITYSIYIYGVDYEGAPQFVRVLTHQAPFSRMSHEFTHTSNATEIRNVDENFRTPEIQPVWGFLFHETSMNYPGKLTSLAGKSTILKVFTRKTWWMFHCYVSFSGV